jgi:hypothetical protein
MRSKGLFIRVSRSRVKSFHLVLIINHRGPQTNALDSPPIRRHFGLTHHADMR